MNKVDAVRRIWNFAEQAAVLRTEFPDFRASVDYRSRKGVWKAKLTPGYLSETYDVRFMYRFGSNPKVFVDSPQIRADAPHRYKEDRSLCLFHPRYGGWSGHRLIAITIVPWAAHWLWCYEGWLVTGAWHGEEFKHHGAKRQ